MSMLPPECKDLPQDIRNQLESLYQFCLSSDYWTDGQGNQNKAAQSLKHYLKRLQYFGVYETDEIQWITDLESARAAHQASLRSTALDESRDMALQSLQDTANLYGRSRALQSVRQDIRAKILERSECFFTHYDCANAADDIALAAAWKVVSDLQLEPSPFDPLMQIWSEGFWPIGPLAGKFVIYAPTAEERKLRQQKSTTASAPPTVTSHSTPSASSTSVSDRSELSSPTPMPTPTKQEHPSHPPDNVIAAAQAQIAQVTSKIQLHLPAGVDPNRQTLEFSSPMVAELSLPANPNALSPQSPPSQDVTDPSVALSSSSSSLAVDVVLVNMETQTAHALSPMQTNTSPPTHPVESVGPSSVPTPSSHPPQTPVAPHTQPSPNPVFSPTGNTQVPIAMSSSPSQVGVLDNQPHVPIAPSVNQPHVSVVASTHQLHIPMTSHPSTAVPMVAVAGGSQPMVAHLPQMPAGAILQGGASTPPAMMVPPGMEHLYTASSSHISNMGMIPSQPGYPSQPGMIQPGYPSQAGMIQPGYSHPLGYVHQLGYPSQPGAIQPSQSGGYPPPVALSSPAGSATPRNHPDTTEDPLAEQDTELPRRSPSRLGLWLFLLTVLALGGAIGWYLYNQSPGVLFEKASALLQQQKWTEAEPLLQLIRKKEPNFSGLDRALGHVYFSTQRDQEAFAAYSRAVDKHPQDGLLQRNLAYLYLQKKEWPDALRLLEQASTSRSTDSYVWMYLGAAQIQLQRYSFASQSLRKATRLAPQNAAAWNDLGTALLQEARLIGSNAPPPPSPPPTDRIQQLAQEAESAFRKAKEIQSTTALYHRNFGDALALQNKHEEADQAYVTAIQQDASQAGSFNNRAALLLQQNRYADALPLLTRAVSLLRQEYQNSTSAEVRQQLAHAYFNLGATHEGLKQKDEALQAYRQATMLHPDDADSFCRLGRLLHASHQNKLALPAYQSCLRLDPGNQQAKRMVQRLDK